jgi:hypothetical protein
MCPGRTRSSTASCTRSTSLPCSTPPVSASRTTTHWTLAPKALSRLPSFPFHSQPICTIDPTTATIITPAPALPPTTAIPTTENIGAIVIPIIIIIIDHININNTHTSPLTEEKKFFFSFLFFPVHWGPNYAWRPNEEIRSWHIFSLMDVVSILCTDTSHTMFRVSNDIAGN